MARVHAASDSLLHVSVLVRLDAIAMHVSSTGKFKIEASKVAENAKVPEILHDDKCDRELKRATEFDMVHYVKGKKRIWDLKKDWGTKWIEDLEEVADAFHL